MSSCKCSVCIRCKLEQARELLKRIADHDDYIQGDDAWYAMESDLRSDLDNFLEDKQ